MTDTDKVPRSRFEHHHNLFIEGHGLCPGPAQHDFIIQCWTIFAGMAPSFRSLHILSVSTIGSCSDGVAPVFGTVQCKHQHCNFCEEYAAAAEKMMSRSLCFIWHQKQTDGCGWEPDLTEQNQREID